MTWLQITFYIIKYSFIYLDFEFVNLATQNMKYKLLKRWTHYDIEDLEETLENLILINKEESLGKDSMHNAVSQFMRCWKLLKCPHYKAHIPL